ncbi:unnamed protein product [Ilex paraguariensis]|uniref:Uncharacterized protein n=1 Tax=Ilex paraguariensis TaxID=185542 RepID=A0ABC8U0W0_9AQUA
MITKEKLMMIVCSLGLNLTFIFGMVEVTHRNSLGPQWRKWTWVSDRDLMMNGAFFVQSGDLAGARTYAGLELIRAAPGSAVSSLTSMGSVQLCTQIWASGSLTIHTHTT